MRNVFWNIGATLLEHYLTAPRQAPQMPVESPLNQIAERIRAEARRYAGLVIAGFFCGLYFFAGTILTLAAIALGYDEYGIFFPGALFYTGLALSLVSALAFAFVLWRVRNRQAETDALERAREPAGAYVSQGGTYQQTPPTRPEFRLFQVAEPLISGLVSAFVARRLARREKLRRHHEDPENPPRERIVG
jgi:hypothetical protein